MAMSILNNSATAMALGETNKNTNKLGKALKKVSFGMKINSAGDSAAEYSISEKMRVQIRSLTQDEQNVKNGKALLRIAEGGIQNIIDELRSMKEMAINAANGHNTDSDRAILQKEYQARLDSINDIAATTNYNGRLLLNGPPPKVLKEIIDEGAGESAGGTSGGSGEGSSVSIPKIPSITISPVPVEPLGSITIINGDYTITKDGIYKMDTNYHGTITILADNVELQQTDAEVTNACIKGNGIAQNIWLNNINITNKYVKNTNSLIDNLGAGSTLNFIGKNRLTSSAFNIDGKSVIHINNDVTINGFGTSTELIVGAPGRYYNYGEVPANGYNADIIPDVVCIGSNSGELSTGNIVINNVGTLMTASEMGACIGSGSNGGTIGDIIINDSYVQTQNCNGAGIGSGISNSSCGDIYINNSKIYGNKYISRVDRIDIKQDASVPFGGALTTSFGANIGSGCKSSSGNIYINDSYCRGGDSSYGAAIGSGYYGASRDIIINNSEILAGAGGSEFTSKDNFDIYLSSGAGIGSGKSGSVGNITISGNSNITARSFNGAAIGAGSIDDTNVATNYPFDTKVISNYGTLTGGSSSVGTIIIEGGKIYAESKKAEAIGGGEHAYDSGSKLINSGTGDYEVPIIYTDWRSSVGDIYVAGGEFSSEFPNGKHIYKREPDDPTTKLIKVGDESSSGGETGTEGTGKPNDDEKDDDENEEEYKYTYILKDPLIIHTGPKSSQELRVYISGMSSKCLELDGSGLTPIEKALEALGVLDKALEYSLENNTRVGSYISRLDYTEDNLVTSRENTILAESVIRDADMAKEMMEYAKTNVLSQSSQAMLAQSNQMANNVFSLLQ